MLDWIVSLYTSVRTILAPLLNRFFLAVLILLVGIIIGRIASTFLQKFLHTADINKLVSQGNKSTVAVEQIVSYAVRYVIYFLFFLLALNTIGLTSWILTGLGVIVFIIFILSVFLGIKDFIPNAIAGLMLRKKGFVKVGDRIEANGVSGKIIQINLIDTQIKNASGDFILVPNVLLSQKELKKVNKGKKKKILNKKHANREAKKSVKKKYPNK